MQDSSLNLWDQNGPPTLSQALWLRLLDATDRLQPALWTGNRETGYQRLSDAFRELVDCRTALWLVGDEKPEMLQLVACSPACDHGTATEFPLAAFEFTSNQPVRVRATKAQALPEDVAFCPAQWLQSVRWPIRDRKNRRILGGLIAVQDTAGGVLPEEAPALGTLFAPKAAAAIETGRLLVSVQDLLKEIQEPQTFPGVLEVILRKAVRLLGADRGDIAYYDWEKGRLVICPWQPLTRELMWETLPRSGPRGLIRKVWDEKSDLLLISDVSASQARQDYVCCDEQTRSELLVKLSLGDRRLAVLNLESFKEGGFDEQDGDRLRFLTQGAVDHFPLIEKKSRYGKILEVMAERGLPREKIAESILESVRAIFGYERGIIYIPNYSTRQLRAFVQIGLDRDLNADPFVYEFNESALATLVFRTKEATWIEHPLEDYRINRKGVHAFEIKDPIVGVPMLDGTEVIGVLVAWSKINPPPTKDHLRLLLPFVRLATLLLREDLAQKRSEQFIKAQGRILKRMQQTLDLETNLREVMLGVEEMGFDRIRVFRYEPGDESMRGLFSSGMGEYAFEARPYRATMREGEDFNPLVKRLIDGIRGEDQAGLLAKRYAEPDPHAARLGKEDVGEWIDVPLISAGKLYGELSADNKFSRRRITADDLEYFNAMGALAARAFAIHEKRGMLNTRSMSQLYNRISVEPDRRVVLQCLLHYLTHPSEGLGFSNALFFGAVSGSSGLRLEVVVSARSGEVTEALSTVLQRAGSGNKAEVRHDLAGLMLSWDTPAVQTCLDYTKSQELKGKQEAAPFHYSPLQQALGRTTAIPMIAAPVRGNAELTGLLVVDRAGQWREMEKSEADRASLWSFTQEAGQILLVREVQLELEQKRYLAKIGFVTQGLRHELYEPVSLLKLQARSLPTLCGRLRGLGVNQADRLHLLNIQSQIERLDERVTVLEELGKAVSESSHVSITEILASLKEEVGPAMADSGIVFSSQSIPDSLVCKVMSSALRFALRNLVTNAEHAISGSGHGKYIAVTASLDDDVLVIRVKDDGPGIPGSVLVRLNEEVSITTKPGRGMGWGLMLVRRIVEMHDGTFEIKSETGHGTEAIIRIPARV